ncbi:MAG TPA: cyclopropane-fatty-acyl-phospholipid synthase family protein [Candidatus Methylomirabilis sp.]|nr:cyclopropane-fatty-acyl-phospholipid synthase family protein [Candidatus Methylomirabilis sp.]
MTAFARLVDRVAARCGAHGFAIELWDGTRRALGAGSDDLVIRFRDRRTCLGLLANPSLRFGDAYVDGAIEVEGDLGKLMERLLRLGQPDLGSGLARRALASARSWSPRNSPFRARKNASYHYDLGNEFFRLWLGRTMAYSCAYFREPTDDLDTAQEQKFRHVCEKLRLEPGLTLLDIGCGWGGLAAYAASHYGVDVVGITLSEAQKRGADEMIMANGLASRVTIRAQDYRELAPDRPFDRIVSIGMFEHVGRRLIPRYLRETARLLKPGGVGLLHTIGRVRPAPTDAWIGTRVFPGAYFPALAEILAPMGEHRLHTVDVEALGPHYALTLDRWREGFERSIPVVTRMYDARFVRMWRLYLAGSAAAFRVGNLTVWQIQFTKGPPVDLPLTREYLYQERTAHLTIDR